MFVMAFLSSPVLLGRYFPEHWRFTIIVNALADVYGSTNTKTRVEKVPEKGRSSGAV
jgi:hypothetical protein